MCFNKKNRFFPLFLTSEQLVGAVEQGAVGPRGVQLLHGADEIVNRLQERVRVGGVRPNQTTHGHELQVAGAALNLYAYTRATGGPPVRSICPFVLA